MPENDEQNAADQRAEDARPINRRQFLQKTRVLFGGLVGANVGMLVGKKLQKRENAVAANTLIDPASGARGYKERDEALSGLRNNVYSHAAAGAVIGAAGGWALNFESDGAQASASDPEKGI